MVRYLPCTCRMSFSPPEAILRPLEYKEKTLFGPGPSNCYPSVLEAMCRQPYGIYITEMLGVMNDITDGLKYLFQTNNKMTYAVSATGMSGMESTLVNLVEPGDKVLALESGLWGARAADLVTRMSKDDLML